MTFYPPSEIPSGRTIMGDVEYMPDAKGAMVPVGLIKPQHLLEDELVRKVMGHAIALSEQVSRFKEHTFDDLGAFEALLAQEYESTVGGAKGNKTLSTHDGLFKVSVQLLRLEITDPRWLQAMKAIRDAMRVEGSKTYVRCHRRATVDGAWQAVSIDLAKA